MNYGLGRLWLRFGLLGVPGILPLQPWHALLAQIVRQIALVHRILSSMMPGFYAPDWSCVLVLQAALLGWGALILSFFGGFQQILCVLLGWICFCSLFRCFLICGRVAVYARLVRAEKKRQV